MNANQLTRMLARAAMAALMSVGIPRLVDWWARRGSADPDADRPLTEAERKRAADARGIARRLRQTARLTRRF